ncbi:endonuclease/exonuclease/phosphatase family protein [Formosa sp. PL04]|uniref:endonuclease/exonuclease/phosphatase family protein n=1 Tax=Formosa sp. PL04 TaxID=3081755 RepID=UPI002981B82B|nr:endonuclease/exonuclease/phosphatase family protein [Formosa sp. PL04]MDW5287608.1 endonuclease/exonuclease/phosphatase family protein [Formosa sp. PL04]
MYWYNNYHFKTEDTTVNTALNTHSVLYWNISRPDQLPLDVIFKNMKDSNPEIIVLVEAKDIPYADIKFLKRHYPSYDIQQLEGEMMIAVNGEINDVEYKKISRGSKANLVTATINNRLRTILVIDLLANPALSKKADFKMLESIIESQHIDFIIGDFNTTYESVYFEAFTSDYESFHKYNNGFTATWPSVLPLLEIDHFWLSKKWKPIILHKEFNTDSDHGLLLGKFQLKP